LLLDALTKHIPFGWANAIQACLFASVHENHRLFLFFVSFGVICGILARRSGSLLAPILLHGLNNLLVCLVMMNAKP
jgi:membrane protease YdiL (CAAX protease family)